MIVYTHNDCLKKFNGQNHPERKERLDSIIGSLKTLSDPKINFKKAPLAKMSEILLLNSIDKRDGIIALLEKQLEQQDKAIERKDKQFLGLRSAYQDEIINRD